MSKHYVKKPHAREYSEGSTRRKIRLIEGNAKCRHLQTNLSVKGHCGRCSSVCGADPHAPHLYTVYVYTVYLFTQGRGGGGEGVELERRLEGQQSTKLGQKYQHD